MMKVVSTLAVGALLILIFSGVSAAPWQQQTGWVLVYEHDSNGIPIEGDINLLANAALHGADIKVSMPSSDKTAFFLCDWLYAKEGYVACFNTSHISVRGTEGNDFGFQDNAYHWYVMVNTEGKRDMSRWNVGEHRSRGHTQDRTAMGWWVRTN